MIIKAVKGFFSGGSDDLHYTLKLKGRLNLEPGSDDFLMEFEPFLKTHCLFKQVTIDLTEVTFIYPVVIFLLLGVKCQLEDRKIELNLIVNESSDVAHYLFYCGLNRIFPELEVVSQNSPVVPLAKNDVMELSWQTTLPEPYKTAADIVDWFIQKQDMSPSVEANVIDSIDEILRNIKQHSGFLNFGYVGQAFPNSSRMRLVFYDDGIGIKKHLTKMPYQETHKLFQKLISASVYKSIKDLPANHAIEKASIYEVSGTNYSKNSGAGLDFILKELSPPTNGIVSIISGDGHVAWKGGELCKSYALPFKLNGTLVAICIDIKANTILKYNTELLNLT